MALELYRRHNAQKCKTSSPTDSSCTNTRKPCPIWVRGTQADGTYVRQPLKLRDWKEAQKVSRMGRARHETQERRPRTTIEQLKTSSRKHAVRASCPCDNQEVRSFIPATGRIRTRQGTAVCKRIGPCDARTISGDVERRAHCPNPKSKSGCGAYCVTRCAIE